MRSREQAILRFLKMLFTKATFERKTMQMARKGWSNCSTLTRPVSRPHRE